MVNGQWVIDNGQRATGKSNEKKAIYNARYTMDNGPFIVDKWAVKMANGQCMCTGRMEIGRTDKGRTDNGRMDNGRMDNLRMDNGRMINRWITI